MAYSVVIPSKNFANLSRCVEALHRNSSAGRIIVVDDGIAETGYDASSPEYWKGACLDGATILPGIKPFVYARNVNIGIRAAGQDDVVLLNDDALLRNAQGFPDLAKFAEKHPEVGCVAPATNVTGQPLQWPSNRTPEGFRYVDTVPYVCVYIPRRVLDQVGLLDERYCLDYGVEDLDHTEAMKRAGLKIAVLYNVFVDHGSLISSFRGDPRQPKSFQQNYALFKQKWGIA